MNLAEIRNNQLVILTGILVFSILFEIPELVYLATILGLIFLTLPGLGRLFIKGWLKLAELLGWINSRILLLLIFYLVLCPISFVYKIFSKDALQLKFKNQKTFYFNRDEVFDKRNLENPW